MLRMRWSETLWEKILNLASSMNAVRFKWSLVGDSRDTSSREEHSVESNNLTNWFEQGYTRRSIQKLWSKIWLILFLAPWESRAQGCDSNSCPNYYVDCQSSL